MGEAVGGDLLGVLAGSNTSLIALLAWLLLVALVCRLGYVAYLRSNNPEIYDALNEDLERVDWGDHQTWNAA